MIIPIKVYHHRLNLVLASLIFVSFLGCRNLQPAFSEQAYRQTVSLKVESLELMEHASEEFSQHEANVHRLQTELRKAYEYAAGRPNNSTTASQWEILISPDRNLLGGFLQRWKQQGNLSLVFINENKRIIADAFDTIIELESGKRKPSSLE